MADCEVKKLREVLSHALPELKAWRNRLALDVRKSPPDKKYHEHRRYLDQIIETAEHRLNPKRDGFEYGQEEQDDG